MKLNALFPRWAIIALTFIFASSNSFATTYTAVASTDWNAAGTWSPDATPVAGDVVNIPAGFTITIPAGYAAACASVNINSDAADANTALNFGSSASSLTVSGNVDLTECTSVDSPDKTGTLDVNGGTLTISGNLTVNADTKGGDKYFSTVILNGGSLTVSGNTTLTSDKNSATATIDMTGDGTAYFGGSLTLVKGGGIDNSSGTVGTIVFNGVGAQTIPESNGTPSIDYFNLTLATSGVKTAEDDMTVNGTFSIQGTATYADGGSSDLTYGATATLEYKGSAAQSSGDELAASMVNIIIDNSNGVTFNVSTAISGTLTMTDGNINASGNTVEIGTSAASPGTLAHTSGTIYGGTLKRWFSAASVSGDQGLFPIGTASEYRPIQITSTADITSGGSISSTHTDASNATDVSIIDGGVNIERTHDMSSTLTLADGITGGTFDVDITYSSFVSSGNLSDIRLTKDDAVVGTHAASSGTVDNPTAKRTGVAMGDLAGGWKAGTTSKADTPLPVVLLSFTAALVDNTQVALRWSTASESNNDYFTVERSVNGLSFEEVAEVPGAGNSSSREDYETFDDAPIEGLSYYRLKQTDYDGKFEHFDVVAVRYELSEDGSCVLSVFPNPCIGRCTVNLSECEHNKDAEIRVEMIDALGNLVYSNVPYREFDGSFQFSVDPSNNLKPGVYIIRGTSATESYSNKIIVK